MKTGKTLSELAAELERQVNTRQDFLAPTTKLKAASTVEKGERIVGLTGLTNGDLYPVNEWAHGQLAGELTIYKPYYDRMRADAPDLWVQNVNHWLAAEPKTRLVRTLDHTVRAYVSDSYRPLDNYDLLAAAIPALQEMGDAKVESCDVTDRKLYLKIVRPSVQWDMAMTKREAMIKSGVGTHAERPGEDVLQAAIVIGNSEVSDGALFINEAIHRLVCYNLATVSKTLRKTHVGRRHDGLGDDVQQLLSSEARQADDRAFWLKFRDVVKAAFNPERFQAHAERFALAGADRIDGDVEKAVEVTAVKLGFNDTTRQGLLKHLIEGGELTRLGLINAVTRQSQDEADYDLASTMEQAGGKLINLTKDEWRAIATAK